MGCKTILFGLDGATYTILDPLMASGDMPNLKRFMERGVRATLGSTPNPLTPPAWTTMITGCLPGRHGVFDFIQPVESDDGFYFKLTDSRDVQCDSAWTILSNQGFTSASLNFVLTFPPRPFRGLLVPGWVSGRHMRRAVQPPELFDELKALPGFSLKEVAWDLDMEKKAIQDVDPEEYEPWIECHLCRQQQWAAILLHVLQNYSCDLIAFVDDGPDKLQHLAWPYLDPSCFPREPSERDLRIRELCRAYFQSLDRLLGEVIAHAGRDARIFIASDHGFCGTRKIFYINEWLREHGYLRWREDAPTNESEDIAASRMKTQYEMLDWSATQAYSPTPSCCGIYIRQAGGARKAGIRPDTYEAFRRKLASELLAYRDPDTCQPVVRGVMFRDDAFPGPYLNLAPDLTLQLHDHSFPSVVKSNLVTRDRKAVTGTHHPDGILLAAGEGIRKGAQVERCSIQDVCPALLYSAGAKIPAGLDGVLPEHLFESGFLECHPPVFTSRTPFLTAAASVGSAAPDDEETADLVARLKAMGYIE